MKPFALWCAVLAVAASLLVAADFRSRDPDSALYARLSAELAVRPASQWIAPEWNGAWDQHGLFREHPVGILLPTVLLIRAGFPPGQAAYAVNLLYQAAVLALIPLVAAVLVRGREARALAWVLQLMPVAFVYRIRGNQEHPLLMCFLALLYATHRARAQPPWMLLMAASLCFLVLVKGAFAMFALVSAALWLLIVPAPDGGSNRRGWIGLGLAAAVAVAMMAGYEALYVRTTGESFLDFYRSTRLGASMRLDDPRVIPHALVNAGWYSGRLAWFAAPWSLVAFATVAVWVKSRGRTGGGAFDRLSDRGLLWGVLVAAVFIAVLSPANVRAERFIFPLYFIAGTVGVAAAIRRFERVGRAVERTDAMWWLPAGLWLALFLASLGSRALR
jgi:hypothetical protein